MRTHTCSNIIPDHLFYSLQIPRLSFPTSNTHLPTFTESRKTAYAEEERFLGSYFMVREGPTEKNDDIKIKRLNCRKSRLGKY